MAVTVLDIPKLMDPRRTRGPRSRFGTLPPAGSPWAKEFKKFADDVSSDIGGELVLDYQWNGQAGDEALMVQKIRTGQLDAAAVSTGNRLQAVSGAGGRSVPGQWPESISNFRGGSNALAALDDPPSRARR